MSIKRNNENSMFGGGMERSGNIVPLLKSGRRFQDHFQTVFGVARVNVGSHTAAISGSRPTIVCQHAPRDEQAAHAQAR
jgi:hypothetical protein